MDIVYQDGNRSVVVVMKAIDWVATDFVMCEDGSGTSFYPPINSDMNDLVQGQTDDAKYMTSEESALKRC